ncbi:type IV pilus modification protein PilV [Entomomonas sp. E2T0]|uniref:type IV pilus modification protein PilV n=1 Tax=Entomomonas sp. E2T0 TaxID=2930213 RepID=UPI0022283658|nr:type IV pilus modification protein PilV [Entomomonas sp. E2T0]UYZ85523.1 type IV pilus modification protein PilV [Entomomonas sp. E2T0]
MIKMNAQRGFSILEVLIAFVILVIGILGASILIIRSSQVNVKAYETEQVALMANTFIEKMRVNSTNMDEYVNDQTGSQKSNCQGIGHWCSGTDMAAYDIYNFNQQINRLAVKNVTWSLSEEADDIMGVAGNKRYKLSITWDTAKEVGADPGASTEGSYYSYFIVNTAL